MLKTGESMAVDTPTCCHQQAFGCEGCLNTIIAADRHSSGIHNGGVTPKQGDPAAVKHLAVNTFKAVNLFGLVVLPSRHVKRGVVHPPPIGSNLRQFAPKLGGVHHEFFRHTAANHTCATQAVALNQGHTRPMSGCPPG